MAADWSPDLTRGTGPRYLAIADAIAGDVASGRLSAASRLPPQRVLAARLDLDFTTVARGYVEAKRRGLIESRVGQGTFVAASAVAASAASVRSRPEPGTHPEIVDLSMNLPPEPHDPELLERMRLGLDAVGRDLVMLMRYQGFGGIEADKEAASAWLSRRGLVPRQDRVFIVAGAHPALLGIFGLLARQGDTILSEAITYPGIRAIAAGLGLRLIGLPMDDEGVRSDAFAAACASQAPKALYLNPTLLNPTTHTISTSRRMAIAEVARRFGVPIVEDDPYGTLLVDGPPAFAALAPDLTWHVAGLAKSLGAGLRVAYVVVPDARSGWSFAASLRTATVMASPLTVALATRWIVDGTADALLASVRRETAARQRLATDILGGLSYRTNAAGFHLWASLPEPWTRAAFVGLMRASGIGIVASDAFVTEGITPPEAVRVCLGGPADRLRVRGALEFMAHALAEQPERASHFL